METSGFASKNRRLQSTDIDGHFWEVTDKTKLRRFLCYGSEEAVYNVRGDDPIYRVNVSGINSMLKDLRGLEVVQEIQKFAQDERAVNIETCFYALALCSQDTDLLTKQLAYSVFGAICKDPAHLLMFIRFKKDAKYNIKSGMWGRSLRKAVSDWYNNQDPMSLAVAVTRCKQRGGWSHQDLLRLTHTKPKKEATALICKYVSRGWKEVQLAYADQEKSAEVEQVLSYLEVVEKVKHSHDETEVVNLLEEHKLEKEHLLNDHLKSKQVWGVFVRSMPLDSLLKTLGKLTFSEILEAGNSETRIVCERLQSEVKEAGIHPFSILFAMETYKRGNNFNARCRWEPDCCLLKAMESAFYTSFMNVEPVRKRFLVALDIGNSPSRAVPGLAISASVAAVAVAMLFTRTETDTHVLAFTEGTVVPCSLSAQMCLTEASANLMKGQTQDPLQRLYVSRLVVERFGILLEELKDEGMGSLVGQSPNPATDCSQPIKWATENNKCVDVFIILTTNPAWTNLSGPVEALKKHRSVTGANSKLVVCGLTSIVHELAGEEDRGLLTICGFDLGALSAIRCLAQDLI